MAEPEAPKPGLFGGSGFLGMSAPEGPPPDYMGMADKQAAANKDLLAQQTAANRPNITTATGFQRWDGNNMTTGLTGPLGETQQALQAQYAQNMSVPFDYGQFGQAQTGDAARDQAINAAYGQATSRLDPQWKQRESGARAQLLNQGLTEGSEAYNTAMGNLGQQRNDAYTSAMASAIGQGTAAGDSAFRNNMMARQTSMAEALRARGMPGEELARLNGFVPGSNFNPAGAGQAPNYMGAAGQQQDYINAMMGRQAEGTGAGLGFIAEIIKAVLGK
jgi:hypothetical protein